MTEDDDRYSRQRRLNSIGTSGMAKIRQAHICIVGIGALALSIQLNCVVGPG